MGEDDNKKKNENKDLEAITTNDTAHHPLVIMVRGTFGTPFLDALANCGHMPLHSVHPRQQRRKRRKVLNPSQPVRAMALSKEEQISFSEGCRSLYQSLSLPAVLSCHVVVVGQGTLYPGAEMLFASKDGDDENRQKMMFLGMVTCGSFSIQRGGCHGIGMIGAARFLQALATGGFEQARITRQPNLGTREMALMVQVKYRQTECSATISLLKLR